jgi:hypothetical protein
MLASSGLAEQIESGCEATRRLERNIVVGDFGLLSVVFSAGGWALIEAAG